VGLERGPLSLVSTTEALLGSNSSGSGLENHTAVEIRHADHVAPSIRKKLALTLLTSGGRSVGIVRLRTHGVFYASNKKLCKYAFLTKLMYYYTVLEQLK
jgi:hypothetical protein